MCIDEGKKASVKMDEIVIYWEQKLPCCSDDHTPLRGEQQATIYDRRRCEKRKLDWGTIKCLELITMTQLSWNIRLEGFMAVIEVAEVGIECEPIRVDDYTGKKMTFFHDPDGLPLELHE